MCIMLLCVIISVSFATTPVLTTVTGSRVFPCRSNGVDHLEEFRCQNATGCVSRERVCDGVNDCADASDEALCPYTNIRSQSKDSVIPDKKKGSKCRESRLPCRNGTCASSSGDCDCTGCSERSTQLQGSRVRRYATQTQQPGTCVLPPYPNHGSYEVLSMPDARPGDSFDSFLLTVTCRRGYGFVEPDGKSDGNDTQSVYCINGNWLRSIPKCVHFCRLVPDPSITYMCHVPGIGYKHCKKFVAPGIPVKPICNGPIYYSTEDLRNMNCISGFWDYIPQCKAECGRVSPTGQQLVIGGELAERGELPWHAGIYLKTTTPYKQICGGSLVSNNVVVSAAHCFWSDVWKQLPPGNYAVAIGKIYRPWDNVEDVGVQKSDVKKIKMPPLFKGEATNFQEDIAIVILATPFVYLTYVRPVCLNFDSNFDRWQLQPGKLGKVAGWGLTETSGNPSSALRVVEIPYINIETCINNLPTSFTEYITSDKFCAGYSNGTALCKGDSGGGLAFADKEQGIHRYYLRGVVSTAPNSEDKLCNDYTYTTFTKISKHEEFIRRSLAESVTKVCPPYLFQCADGACLDQDVECNNVRDCADGSDEAEVLCSPEMASSTSQPKSDCVLPPYPFGGTYVVDHNRNAVPGQVLDSFVLTVSCHRGNIKVTADGSRDWDGSQQIFCLDGKLSHQLPKCLHYCHIHPDGDVRYNCDHPVQIGLIMPCNIYVPNEKFLNPICGGGPLKNTTTECVSGSLNYDPLFCKTECGEVTALKEDQLVIDGKPDKLDFIPWQVSMYKTNGEGYSYICGGSLISSLFVISAGICFWDEEKGHIRFADYAAVSGQFYQMWDYEKNIHAQKSNVSMIMLPELYPGKPNPKSIAALVLDSPFTYNTFVRPVCLHFGTEFDSQQLQPGNEGKIAGWGRSAGTTTPSQEVIELPNVDYHTCEETLYKQEDITSANTCASYTNDTLEFVTSNIGSGLVFGYNSSGIERYFLRGVLVNGCFNYEDCKGSKFAVFAKISTLKNFIQKLI